MEDDTVEMRFREKFFDRHRKYYDELKTALKYSDYELFDIIMERMKLDTDELLHQKVAEEIEADQYNIL